MVHDGEIVGLRSSSNGSACEQHTCCGMNVAADALLRLKIDTLELEEGLPKTVVKAILIWDGTETCTIGFLPSHIAARPQARERLSNKFAQLIELYDVSESPAKQAKSERNHGICTGTMHACMPTPAAA